MSKVFCSSLRYSIYKVQPLVSLAFASAESLFILAQKLSFVKNFFQVFSNFFFSAFLAAPSRKRFDILAHCFQFVKNFFQVFSNFFSVRYISRCSRRQPAYVITSETICQELFSSFFKFLFRLCRSLRFRSSARATPSETPQNKKKFEKT